MPAKGADAGAHAWIRFLRDCYEADNREVAIFDLRHDKVEHLHLLRHGGDFLEGSLDCIPIDREAALAAQKTARLYESEKSLVFCAFLIEGTIREPDSPKPRRLCAPLMFFPTAVEDAGDHAMLRVDTREQRANTRVLSALLGDGEVASSYLDEILSRIPLVPFARHRIQTLIDAFAEFLPQVDTSPLIEFAHGAAELDAGNQEASAASAGGALRCRPVCAMALVPNSPDTRAVLTELAQVASRPTLSAPLRALFGDESTRVQVPQQPARVYVPAALSSAQQKALRSAAAHPLTLIIGPPGTGKSYTVAAAAVDHVLRRQSVLVVAKTAQALDVIADKIHALTGDREHLLRGGRSGYTQQLKESLDRWLHEADEDPNTEPADPAAVRRLQRQVASQAAVLERLESLLEQRARWEIEWGDQATPRRIHLLKRWLRGCRLKLTEWQLARQDCYWDLMAHYQQQLAAHQEMIARWFRTSLRAGLVRLRKRHRSELVLLDRALRARTNRKKQQWFAQSDLRLLFDTFPIWLATVADLGELLPFELQLFDLAIVDEATQCDMASALPAFFRARRAAITGDPRQLRHLSFLSRERQRQLAAKWDRRESDLEIYDYRERSLLDLVNERLQSQDQVAFLDEHFRSRPPIIAFSNRQFYHGHLKIMTDRPEAVRQPSLLLRRTDGRRAPAGPNQVEAEQLVAEVARWVDSEAHLASGVAHTLGVLSPFREQVDLLFARLSKRLSLAAIEKHRLRVGTAHGFQGEERDVMFLSFAVDSEAHPGSLRYLERPDVFNVSVTRARNLQIVFTSVDPERLPRRSLLRRYLESLAGATEVTPTTPPADAFLAEVCETLSRQGAKTWPGYVVAGLPIDLLVEKEGRSLALDLVGSPGQWVKAFDLEKYRLFQRAGLRLMPLPLSAWRKDRAACLDAIQRWLSESHASQAG